MNLQCVVIEDDSTLQVIYKYILQKADFEVVFARDGKEGLDILQRSTPQLIFLDVRLPQISGLDILAYIETQPRFKHTRIVVTSSIDVYEREVKQEFILKPIQPSLITQIVAETREYILNMV